MQFISVSTAQKFGFIQIQGWDNVVKTIRALGGGAVRADQAEALIAERRGRVPFSDVNPGSLNLMADVVEGGKRQDVYTEALITEGYSWLNERAYQSRWWGRLGPITGLIRRFYKGADHYVSNSWGRPHSRYHDPVSWFEDKSVQVHVLDRSSDIYALGLNANYVGDVFEVALAEYLGVERGFRRSETKIGFSPEIDGRLRFDGDRVTQILGSIFGDGTIRADDLIKGLMDVNGPTAVLVFEDKLIEVRVVLGRWRLRPADNWTRDGNSIVIVKGRSTSPDDDANFEISIATKEPIPALFSEDARRSVQRFIEKIEEAFAPQKP